MSDTYSAFFWALYWTAAITFGLYINLLPFVYQHPVLWPQWPGCHHPIRLHPAMSQAHTQGTHARCHSQLHCQSPLWAFHWVLNEINALLEKWIAILIFHVVYPSSSDYIECFLVKLCNHLMMFSCLWSVHECYYTCWDIAIFTWTEIWQCMVNSVWQLKCKVCLYQLWILT